MPTPTARSGPFEARTAGAGPTRATAASAPRGVWSSLEESSAAPIRSAKSGPWGTISFSATTCSASRQRPPSRT